MKQSQTNTSQQIEATVAVMGHDQIALSDLKNASLIVSILLNAILLIGFMVLQTTSAYDHQVISLLLTN